MTDGSGDLLNTNRACIVAGSGYSMGDRVAVFDQYVARNAPTIPTHAATKGYVDDPLATPVSLVSAVTVTITRANTILQSLSVTNACTLTFASDWPSNTVGRVALELYIGAQSFSLDSTISNVSATISTTAWNSIYFRRGVNRTLWEAR